MTRAIGEVTDEDMQLVWEDKLFQEEPLRFAITFPIISRSWPISTEIAQRSPVLRGLHDRVERELLERLHSESIVARFDFPEDVRVPCEQYLLYFVQFLRDLGVEATSELKHEAGRALFTVTPKDSNEALDKIKTALEVFLRLPSSDFTEGDYEVAIQRLAANIHHLRGQLAISKALLQAKDATIEAQQTTIDNQRHLLEVDVTVESPGRAAPDMPSRDKEELLGGMLVITKYEGKGFEINLAELFRKFRRLFRREK